MINTPKLSGKPGQAPKAAKPVPQGPGGATRRVRSPSPHLRVVHAQHGVLGVTAMVETSPS